MQIVEWRASAGEIILGEQSRAGMVSEVVSSWGSTGETDNGFEGYKDGDGVYSGEAER